MGELLTKHEVESVFKPLSHNVPQSVCPTFLGKQQTILQNKIVWYL